MTKRQEATAVSIPSGTGASSRAGSHPLSGRGSRCGLRDLKVGYMLALKQNHPRLRLRKRQWLNLSRTMSRLMQGLGKKGARKARMASAHLVSGVTSEPALRPSLVGALGLARAILASVVGTAPTTPTPAGP